MSHLVDYYTLFVFAFFLFLSNLFSFQIAVFISLSNAQQQQQSSCTECPTGCKNGTAYLKSRDQTCNCVCAEALCNGVVCPADFTCSNQSRQCVPSKQGACPVQELSTRLQSTCSKDIDCNGDLKCCPFNNNTYYCSSK